MPKGFLLFLLACCHLAHMNPTRGGVRSKIFFPREMRRLQWCFVVVEFPLVVHPLIALRSRRTRTRRLFRGIADKVSGHHTIEKIALVYCLWLKIHNLLIKTLIWHRTSFASTRQIWGQMESYNLCSLLATALACSLNYCSARHTPLPRLRTQVTEISRRNVSWELNRLVSLLWHDCLYKYFNLRDLRGMTPHWV